MIQSIDDLKALPGFSDFVEKLKQEIYLAIPAIVVKHIQDQHKYKKLVDEFYKAHPKLVGERTLVGQVVNKLSAENPDMAVEEVFNLAAKEAYKVMEATNGKKES